MAADKKLDAPVARLLRRGASTLGDHELLAIVLGSRAMPPGTLEDGWGLAAIARASPRELAQVAGVGTRSATRLAAAFELGRRAIELEHHRPVVVAPEDVFRCVSARLAGLQQEVFLAVGLDVRNGLLDVVEVARGSVSSVDVHPREVFRPLVRMAAAGAVLVHNHPSGDPTPSPQDVELTRRMRAVGDVVGIPVIDHVVIGSGSFRSIAEWMGPEL